MAADTAQAVKVLSWFQRNLTTLKQETFAGEAQEGTQGQPELGIDQFAFCGSLGLNSSGVGFRAGHQ